MQAASETDLAMWDGWVHSRLRHLVARLEPVVNVSLPMQPVLTPVFELGLQGCDAPASCWFLVPRHIPIQGWAIAVHGCSPRGVKRVLSQHGSVPSALKAQPQTLAVKIHALPMWSKLGHKLPQVHKPQHMYCLVPAHTTHFLASCTHSTSDSISTLYHAMAPHKLLLCTGEAMACGQSSRP